MPDQPTQQNAPATSGKTPTGATQPAPMAAPEGARPETPPEAPPDAPPEPRPDKSPDQAPDRSLECDLVMRGGITSGIVYPTAVAELARSYRFRSIGGTSAGAIAATVTAAASLGQRNGHDGFARVAAVPEELARVRRGRTALRRLFIPQWRTRPLLRLLLAALRPEQRWRAMGGALLIGFPLWAALGALPGLLLIAAAVWLGGLRGEPDFWSLLVVIGAVLVALPVAAVAAIGTAGFGALRRARSAIPANRYGLCSGMRNRRRSRQPGLTEWLHDLVQETAGRGSEDPPVTFADLWGSADPAADRDIELVLMTSNATRGVSHRVPFLEGPGGPLFFREADIRALLPAAVADWMVAKARPVTDERVLNREGFLRLPIPGDLPILFGARLSLSFPFLLSAVPLYMPKPVRHEGEQVRWLTRCWFSDGGLTSNFPIHFFDSPLPSRPTFAINLTPTTVEVEEARRTASEDVAGVLDPDEDAPDPSPEGTAAAEGVAPDEETPRAGDDASWDRIWMPTRNSSGFSARFNEFEGTEGPDTEPARRGSIAGFFEAIFDTARNWADNEQMLLPGYRDRIVHVRLAAREGGMNLDMAPAAILDVSRRGTFAARLLAARFARTPGLDPQTGRPIRLTWENHKWIRYRSTMAAIETYGDRFRLAWERSKAPDAFGKPYETLIRIGREEGRAYRWASLEQQAHAETASAAFAAFTADWDRARGQTFDTRHPGGRGRSPRPKPQLRTVPPGDSDPRAE